ncbi:uncharacterized protein LOC129241540 [Anastrepha obliqua]|uniref:uncharacterized protein LOC129241540 n=1 Tax=Anastrepha obliqua TaxID=95512 RepID=UPI00240A61F2|nr:uncharacterized protein LOC129241540 [Anastrepha obliqua]XP_054733908.1 uncharacterized protein LOC129241540 [Anastrepha obliqua]
MDATKQLGIGKETARIEQLARRNFQKKWAKLADEKLNRVYNQNEVNQQLKDTLRKQELCPFKYTGQGDSFFLSPNMYTAMLATCRCGRQRSETHILKCLQKTENKFSKNSSTTGEINNASMQGQSAKTEGARATGVSFPKTANSLIGWQKHPPSYKEWENSMKHISPIATMPQPRLTETAYHVLHIA